MIECTNPHHWTNPVWHNEYIRPIISYAREGIIKTMGFSEIYTKISGCSGDIQNKFPFEFISGDLCISPVHHYLLSGWAFSGKGELEIYLIKGDDKREKIKINQSMSMDVYDRFKQQGPIFENAKNAAFSLDIICESDCALIFFVNDEEVKSIELSNMNNIDISEISMDLYGNIDKSELFNEDLKQFPYAYNQWIVKNTLIDGLIRIYQTAFPLMGGISLIALLAVIAINPIRKKSGILLIINVLLLAGLISRWTLLAYVSASSFSGQNYLYLSPLYPLFILFTLINPLYYIHCIHRGRS